MITWRPKPAQMSSLARGPADCARMIIPAGMFIPPPRPWSTRKKISDPADKARPQSAEPIANNATTVSHSRLGTKPPGDARAAAPIAAWVGRRGERFRPSVGSQA